MKKFFILFITNLISLTTSNVPPKTCPGPYEVYANCRNVCPPTCESLYSAIPVPQCLPPNPCPPGCNCMAGYVRNNASVCVLKIQCPIPQCSRPNEVFEPNRNYCLETCRSFYRLVEKPPCIPSPPFPLGCKCLPGFVRNDNNDCVRTSDCPPPIVCTRNEVANFCPGPCVPGQTTTCAQYLSNTPGVCPAVRPNPLCVPRCDCATNFLRHNNGLCVRPEDCCVDPNEIAVDCPNPCPLTCDNLDQNPRPACLLKCQPKGCVCRTGFVRDSTGKCILREKCPLKCKDTEVLNGCPGPCQLDDTCKTVTGNLAIACDAPNIIPFPCNQKCFCKPGLVRVGNNCVSPNQCCSDQNTEEAVDCPTNCDDTCEGSAPATCRLTCLRKTCRCKSGHVRNKDGQCILIERCPKCPANEVYKFCDTACEATCDELNPVCTKPCVEGCFCKPGYVRLEKKCVLIKECPLKCQVNEIYNPCAAYCTFEDTCATLLGNLVIDCAPIPKNYSCPRRCECRKGFVRIGDNCVSPDQCCRNPRVEEAVDCPVSCDETCEGKPAAGCVGSTNCIKGCRCRQGLVRNKDKQCVPRRECPSCNGTNEEYRFCSCAATCDNPTGVCSGPCTEGCFCQPGFVRYNNLCIRPAECPPKCVENEVLNLCPAQCSIENSCQSLLSPDRRVCIPSATPIPCRPRCECRIGFARRDNSCIPIDQCCSNPTAEQVVNCSAPCDGNCERGIESNCSCVNSRCGCRNGYVRNVDGICILRTECPRCTGDNEEYRFCGTNCPATCNNLNPVCTRLCVSGCFCLTGYVRYEGRCILPEECPLNCGTNEVFVRCPPPCSFDLDCPRVLDGIVKDCAKPPPKPVCQKRCDCLPGFVRIGSDCVSADRCCNDPTTEVAVNCPALCDDTCNGPALPNCTIARCSLKGCKCRAGLVRDVNNRCIPVSQCPLKCNNPNEEFKECGSSCPPSCDNRNPTCTLQCVRGCFCKDGFIKHEGKCIPVRKCPPTCTDNEVLVNCPDFCATDNTCLNLLSGISIVCGIPPDNYDCLPRCFCRPGFVRIGSRCVSANQCCSNPETQNVFNCSVPCHNTCFGTQDPACVSQNCLRNRCLCREGFVNNTRGVCAPISTCPPPCTNSNEEYKSCGSRCPPTCDDRSPTCSKDCKEGCFCKEGFIKHLEQCIPVRDCPLICTVPNEEFKQCGSCDATCDNLIPTCLPGCNRGCFCKQGFVRHEKACIPQDKCPVKCTGPNEEFNNCGSACPATCTDRVRVCPAVCVSGCFCRPGYVRNNGGVCVKTEECPVICNGTNEEFTNCGTCDPTCDNPNLVCKIACQRGCFCKSGTVRNSDGKCVIPSTCPKKCLGPNEEYQPCGSACPPTCQKPVSTCYVPCVGGCFCLRGYIRKNGVCVKPEECLCGPNELYSNCPPKLQAFCGNSKTIPNPVCKVGCVCAPGFIRSQQDINSVCVTPDKCNS